MLKAIIIFVSKNFKINDFFQIRKQNMLTE